MCVYMHGYASCWILTVNYNKALAMSVHDLKKVKDIKIFKVKQNTLRSLKIGPLEIFQLFGISLDS